MTSYVISSGVVSSGITLRSGDTATVLAGGTTISLTDAGLETVSSGGIASATKVLNGGRLGLLAGATAESMVLS